MTDQEKLGLSASEAGPFSLGTRHPLSPVFPLVEKTFALDALNRLYSRVCDGPEEEFFDRVLSDLRVICDFAPRDLENIPAKGPLVVVANHPFGAIDGIALASVVRKVRPDVRVMANHLLGRIPELRSSLILVDPFGSEASETRNRRPLLQAMRWVNGGGALLVFPAGEVSHLKLRRGRIVEGPWSPTVSRLIRRTNAAVVPAFVGGTNSPAFHVLGLIHPRLRTAMLPREVFNRTGDTLRIRFAAALTPRRLAEFPDLLDDQHLADDLRRRSLILSDRPTPSPLRRHTPEAFEAVCEPVPSEHVFGDIVRLPQGQCLAEAGAQRVYIAYAHQVPNVVREIGRLRELTYRATGEGTGRSTDLDTFDQTYLHLFLHDAANNAIVGAYRIGPSDKLLAQQGPAALYTSTLFRFNPALFGRLNPALELGRAFVRAEYQRSYAPLMLLWKGIAAYVAAHPWYNRLFGPVSISNDYTSTSRELLVRFLQTTRAAEDLTPLARPRNPFRFRRRPEPDSLPLLRDEHDVDGLLNDLEPDGKGIPVLVRQYMKLGAKFISFNVDRDFGDAVDALMVVDLTQTDRRTLDRYMGRQFAAQFLAHHGLGHDTARTPLPSL
jgi:putative hemolysin